MVQTRGQVRKWFIVSISPHREGAGCDFYPDIMTFMAGCGFRTVNTLANGHLRMLLTELLLLWRIGAGETVVTTWPGFPRQMLVFNGLGNRFRFWLFRMAKRLKRWRVVVMPIDLPLIQFQHRLSSRLRDRQGKLEQRLFSAVDVFLCCGQELTKRLALWCPGAKLVQYDLYDQVLPAFTPAPDKCLSPRVRVAASGNLTRMVGGIATLPASPSMEYCFTGPGGEAIAETGRKDVSYLGNLPDTELLPALSQCDYGFILYAGQVADYFANVMSGKVTTYLLAGLPILCQRRYSSMAQFVERTGTGLVFDSTDELPELIERHREDYAAMRQRCLDQIPAIRACRHYRDALVQAGVMEC